RRSGER
ncbi:host specificity protein J, partial [Escherichia coli EC1870]